MEIIDETECVGELLVGFCQGGHDVSRAFHCVHAGLQGSCTDRSGSQNMNHSVITVTIIVQFFFVFRELK